MVMNPTSSAYSFQWTCQDPAAPPGQTAFFCLTERGQIQPGKKAEVGAEREEGGSGTRARQFGTSCVCTLGMSHLTVSLL